VRACEGKRGGGGEVVVGGGSFSNQALWLVVCL